MHLFLILEGSSLKCGGRNLILKRQASLLPSNGRTRREHVSSFRIQLKSATLQNSVFSYTNILRIPDFDIIISYYFPFSIHSSSAKIILYLRPSLFSHPNVLFINKLSTTVYSPLRLPLLETFLQSLCYHQFGIYDCLEAGATGTQSQTG